MLDITVKFRSAAEQIVAGSLVKDEFLSLFEAVGALEIGDPKMDGGTEEHTDDDDRDFDPSTELTPQETIWIMDQLLAMMVSWLKGYPLSLTLFTSVHIDRMLWPEPKLLSDARFTCEQDGASTSTKLLQAFCILSIKNCGMILNMVTSQHYYEEEDLTTQLFQRELLDRFTPHEVQSFVSDLLASCTKQVTADVAAAMQMRVDFQSNLLTMLVQHADCIQCNLMLYADLQDLLVSITTTAHLGGSVVGAFTTRIQRRLASTAPPRPIILTSTDKVWKFWREFIQETQQVFEVYGSRNDTELLTAFTVFGCIRTQLSVYARCLLQSFLSNMRPIMQHVAGQEFLLEAVKQLTRPNALVLDDEISTNASTPTHLNWQHMQPFVTLFEASYMNLFKAMTLNRCRIRRTLCHAIIEWDQKQMETELIDDVLHTGYVASPNDSPESASPSLPFSLSSWVYHHKLNMMRLIIQLGVEQEIYAPHEYIAIYAHLTSVCQTHLLHLERMSHFVAVQNLTRSASNDRNPLHETRAASSTGLNLLFQHYAYLKGTLLLAQIHQSIFIVLNRLGHFAVPENIYPSGPLRHEIRLRPFAAISVPEAPQYQDLAHYALRIDVKTDKLLREAGIKCREAKRAWEEVLRLGWSSSEEAPTRMPSVNTLWRDDVSRLMRIVTAAGALVATLRHTGAKTSPGNFVIPRVGTAMRHHDWWALPRERLD